MWYSIKEEITKRACFSKDNGVDIIYERLMINLNAADCL